MRYKSEITQLTKKHWLDAGYDIYSNETVIIKPKGSAIIGTNLYVEIPDGYAGLLWSRSGLSCNYEIETGAGCIDSSYRGEVKVHLYNHSDLPYTVNKGDKITQMLIVPVKLGTWQKVDELSETERGEKGFGSTGV